MQKNIIVISIIGLLIGGFVIADKCAAGPITIRQVFAEVDAAAKSFADDAELIFIFGRQIDSTGRSSNWGYYYESASLQERFEIPVNDGEVGQLHTNVDLPPNMLPIGEEWIDSDSAVAEAEENGGETFRQMHEDASIEMYLQSEWVNATDIQSVWHILYISDASGESFSYDVIAGEPTLDGEAPDESAPDETTPEENLLSITARELFTDVNSAAQSIADDAQLIYVGGSPVDTTGRNNNWTYVFESASLQERYDFRVINGEVQKQESFTLGWLVRPDQLPIGEEWMDSDAAVAEAEENGGQTFRETYEDAFIEMNLESEWATATKIQPVWHIRYISGGSGEVFRYKVIAGSSASTLGNPMFEASIVRNVCFEQRTDGTGLVDIYYDLTDFRACWLDIVIEASDDNGQTWTLPCTSLTGDVGEYIAPGRDKHVVSDFSMDNPDTSIEDILVRVSAHRMLCGQTITEDLTLVEDLECPPGTHDAIIIGAPNVTLDLGGYVIRDVTGENPSVTAIDVNGITIRNGTFEGFLAAIDLGGSDNATFENLTIRNLDVNDPYLWVTGLVVSGCQEVVIRDSQFEFLQVFHKTAANMGNSHVDVNNIVFIGGGPGLDFSGDVGSSGSVVNSKFIAKALSGILIQSNNGEVWIANNEFSECGEAISTDPKGSCGDVSGLIIEENYFYDGGDGIVFFGTIDSLISNNTITDNRDHGIKLIPNMDCGWPGFECWYSTGNVITGNVVLGNNIDLFHHEKCIGNTWERNTYETSQGVETYTSDPATAREGLAAVNSAAADVAADAQLIFVASWSCDTTGKSYKWVYIYKSADQQSYYEFWYHDGRVIKRDSVSILWMIGEDWLPLPESWLDSDSAIAIADSQGGEEFRETHEVKNIEMNISRTHSLLWQVFYISEEGNFRTFFDASVVTDDESTD